MKNLWWEKIFRENYGTNETVLSDFVLGIASISARFLQGPLNHVPTLSGESVYKSKWCMTVWLCNLTPFHMPEAALVHQGVFLF